MHDIIDDMIGRIPSNMIIQVGVHQDPGVVNFSNKLEIFSGNLCLDVYQQPLTENRNFRENQQPLRLVVNFYGNFYG